MSDGVVLAFVITLGVLCVTGLGAFIRAQRRPAAPEPPVGRVARVLLIAMVPAALLVLAAVVLGISIL